MKVESIVKYQPINEQEEIDKIAIIDFMENNEDAYDRSNLIGHLTSSAIVVNEKMDEVLFVYHNIYNSWSWVGGHNDGDRDFLKVAIKEAKEETGLSEIRDVLGEILMIDVLPVRRHIKRGKFVGNHQHLNITFLLVANKNEKLSIKPDENSGVKWFKIDEVLDYVSEEEMKIVYQKAFDKISNLKKSS